MIRFGIVNIAGSPDQPTLEAIYHNGGDVSCRNTYTQAREKEAIQLRFHEGHFVAGRMIAPQFGELAPIDEDPKLFFGVFQRTV